MNIYIPIFFLLVFFALVVFIGVSSYKNTQSMGRFLLGGREIGPWLTAFAYGTSYFSAVIFIGYAGKTGWTIGMSGILIGIANAFIGSFCAWKVLAKPTREMTHRLNTKTMPEFFEARYNSKFMKYTAAIITFVFLVPYSASVYMGLGYLFSAIFPGVSYFVCMLIIAALTSIYIVLGGYMAAILTDFIQGLLMLLGVFFMLYFIINNPIVGGLSSGYSKLLAIEPDLVSVFGGKNFVTLFSLILLTSFGTWGLPQMIHKFYAIKDDAAIKKATIISTAFALIVGGGAYFVGSFGRLYLNNTLPKEGYDKIVPEMLVTALFGSTAASIVLSIVLLCVLSASMSTLGSIVLTSASAFTIDILSDVKKDLSKKNKLIIMRILCFVLVAVSLLFASLKISFIISLMAFSWGTVAGSFLGPYLWGLYGKNITKTGAIAGMLSGFCSMALLVLGYTLLAPKGFAAATANSPMFGALAMLASTTVTPIVSLFTKKFDTEFINKIF